MFTSEIFIKGLKIFAYHGAIEQEHTTGAYYIIDVQISTDFSQSIKSDSLSGTINYAEVHDIIKREMSIPSQLIEHVAGRIISSIFKHEDKAKAIRLSITKQNPPMGADCIGAGIEIYTERKDWSF